MLDGTWACQSNDSEGTATAVVAGNTISQKYDASAASLDGTFVVKEAKDGRFLIDIVYDMGGTAVQGDPQELVLGEGGKTLSFTNTKNGSGLVCTRK